MNQNTIIFFIIGFLVITAGIFFAGIQINSNQQNQTIQENKTNYTGESSQTQEKIQQQNINTQNQGEPSTYEKPTEQPKNQQYDNSRCTGTGPVNFTYLPVKIEDLSILQPMGLMIGGHVTPIDHQYYYTNTWKPNYTAQDLKGVYAPADGIISEIQVMPNHAELSPDKTLGNWRFIIQHSCTFYTIFINVYQLSPKLAKTLGTKDHLDTPITVKAGELLGGSVGIDFSTNNDETTLKGFIVPEHYSGESWKIHTVDPFDYFVEPIRSQLLAKNMRKFKPYGGKIDYDIDGKLIGNWFVENTNGDSQSNQPDYWKTHLAIAPDALDPQHIIFSIGKFKEPTNPNEFNRLQFGIKGNTPNPAEIGVENGMIKYELTSYDYIDSSGNRWDNLHYTNGVTAQNTNQTFGIVLLQLIEKRKLKVETFPDKTSTQVTVFTSNAVIYER